MVPMKEGLTPEDVLREWDAVNFSLFRPNDPKDSKRRSDAIWRFFWDGRKIEGPWPLTSRLAAVAYGREDSIQITVE